MVIVNGQRRKEDPDPAEVAYQSQNCVGSMMPPHPISCRPTNGPVLRPNRPR
jgi:hypothetical protein